ncbi:MAG: sugar ABC transporter permease [Bacilli bacterium]|nr:sugar ABC transporter permease [Bacilli bacterium]
MENKVKHHRKESIKRYLTVALFLVPYLTFFIIFFIYPLFFGVYISFFRYDVFDPSKSVFVGLDNYKLATTGLMVGNTNVTLYRNMFWGALKNTLLFVGVSVPLLIIIPIFIAILIDIEPKFYKIFRIIFFLPTILSISAVGIIFKWQFDTQYGFVNGILNLFGFESVAWLNSQPYAWIAIIVTTIWWTIGTNTVIIGAGLKEVDKQMYEAAEIDGATYPRIMWSVALPAIRNQIFIIVFTTIIASFNIYGQPDILTGGGPALTGTVAAGTPGTTTVVMMVIRGLLQGVNRLPGLAAAMAIIFGFFILSVSLIQSLINKRREKH